MNAVLEDMYYASSKGVCNSHIEEVSEEKEEAIAGRLGAFHYGEAAV